MIIDCHVHRYPDEVCSNPSAFAKSRGEEHWLKLVAPEDRPSIEGWANRQKMIADMDAASVDKAVLLGWYWQNRETCSLQNQWHTEWIREDPDRFIAFAAFNPTGNNECMDELQRAKDAGFRGIGEMLPAIQGFSMRDPRWLKAVEFAIDSDWPVNFHVSELVGRPLPDRVPTPFEDFQWLVETYPELKVILAHWGGLLPFHELNPHVRKAFANVWYDVAASPLLYDSRVFRTIADTVGAEKILYGSDYPLLLYPSHQTEPDFIRFIEEIRLSELTIKEKKTILGDNFTHLIGLSE